jgi:small subunit ribosomal protein S20
VANTRSAKKRLRQTKTRTASNTARRSAVKTQIRKFLDAVRDKDVDRAKDELRKTTKILDQNAAKGAFHNNTVSRKKSRLAARLNDLVSTAG